MEEQKNHLLPSNYVTILQLKQRWLEEKERRQRASEKPEEQNGDQRLEIQPGESPEVIRSIENLNLHALEPDSRVRNRLQSRNSTHNRFASVINQDTAEDSREKEDQLDALPDKDTESKADDLGLALEKRQKQKKKKKKKKKKQSTVVDEKNPKSAGKPTQNQNCQVEILPEINRKNLRGRGRNPDKKKGIEDENLPNSDNVDRIWEIGSKSRNSSIHDEAKTEDNGFPKHNNGVRREYRDARVNPRVNRRDVRKEKEGALVWVRKGEVASDISHGFHSK